MANFLMSLVFLSVANVDDLLSAKNPEQVLSWHKQAEEVLILRQRCEAEVRGSYFPTNCFLWSKKAKLSTRERGFFENWFSSACVKSLADDASLAQFHLSELNRVQGRCRAQLAKSAQNWLYRVQKEGETEVFQRLKVGNEIEVVIGHETLETRKPHRSKALGTVRRRLN